MSITIRLEPPAEIALRQRAQSLGLTLEDFVVQLLEKESEQPKHYHPKVKASLDFIEKFTPKLGPVPENALDAEFLYGEP